MKGIKDIAKLVLTKWDILRKVLCSSLKQIAISHLESVAL